MPTLTEKITALATRIGADVKALTLRVVDVAHGGTGATDEAGARANLGLTTSTVATPNTVAKRDAGGHLVANFGYMSSAFVSANIELGNMSGSASSPALDFHTGASAIDYDARIMSDTPTGVVGGGLMRYYAKGGHLFDGAMQVSGSINGSAGVFSNGSLCWSRTDFNPNGKMNAAYGALGVGVGPNRVYAPNYQNFTAVQQAYNGAIEVREANLVGTGGPAPGHIYNAPGITFHWPGYAAAKLMMNNAGHLCWGDPNGGYSMMMSNGNLYGSIFGNDFLTNWLSLYYLQKGTLMTQLGASMSCQIVGGFSLLKNMTGAPVGLDTIIGASALGWSDTQSGNYGVPAGGAWRSLGYTPSGGTSLFQRVS